MTRFLLGLAALCVMAAGLTACGGGGGSSSSSSPAAAATSSTPAPPALTNLTPVVVDGGPASLSTGPNGYVQFNFAYVTVTLCAPGTNTCQTIDHVQLDTGSVGLRIPQSVLNASLLSAMPIQTSATGNAVAECYGYVDGYVFGSVRQADFQIGGETVGAMPLQVIGDTSLAGSVPSSCSSGGGSNLNTVSLLGANGVLGVGTTPTDCGSACTTAGGYAAAIYYDCPASGCGSIIARASSTTAPFQQLPNPVAAMAVDNNGLIVALPAPGTAGAASLTGTLYFGIGTQTNNGLGNATPLTASLSTAAEGSGLITALYKNQTLPNSYIDTGSSSYLFDDDSIAGCTGDFAGYYCPPATATISPTLQGATGTSITPSLAIENAQTLLSSSFSALPGLAANPRAVGLSNDYPSSFDFGLPFFYGRNVYVAIEGRSAGGVAGPYYAF
jgi:hypothetical protein